MTLLSPSNHILYHKVRIEMGIKSHPEVQNGHDLPPTRGLYRLYNHITSARSRQTGDSALGKHPRLNHPSCRIQERFRLNHPTFSILQLQQLLNHSPKDSFGGGRKLLLMEPRRIRRIHSLGLSLHRLTAAASTAADLPRPQHAVDAIRRYPPLCRP